MIGFARRATSWMTVAVAISTVCNGQPVAGQTRVAVRVAAKDMATPARQPQWIWSPAFQPAKAPIGICFFRKTFDVAEGATAKLDITCDNRYEVLLNGVKLGTGSNWNVFNTYDLAAALQPGKNVIAVRAQNETAGDAGLCARLRIQNAGKPDQLLVSDGTWRTQLREVGGWDQIDFEDSHWKQARVIGALGTAEPWKDQVGLPGAQRAGRFTHSAEFRVERVLGPDSTGSLIAMTFNEWGEALISREGAGLSLCTDTNQDGIFDKVVPYCDEIKNCQGLLALNGKVFAVGDGPDGAALYEVSDEDNDQKADAVKAILKFAGNMGEHGPHALALGPDGLIYIMLGNHVQPADAHDGDSPHKNFYEGDLLLPKYEDPGGHAVGMKAPAGTVVRTDAEGSFVQCFAGGLRNAYDLVFDKHGELLTYDSDMEWDEQLPWYRPTRVYHVTPGAEFGSRSGWSVWPQYYIDALPPLLDTGRGSPTGVEVYDHFRYPIRYHNAMFACDWSQGRILAIKTKNEGGKLTAKSEVFLEGRPLNVSDLSVGPDGWLYFVTGGRGTEGGLYRIVWNGKTPPVPKQAGIAEAIRQPQLNSAWGRQAIALVQERLGVDWDTQLISVAENSKNLADDRVRALDLMQLFGPAPEAKLLIKLSKDNTVSVRSKATYLLGLITDDESVGEQLETLLSDKDGNVRRLACDAIARGKYAPASESLLPVLADPNRHVAWAARRALETLPKADWQDAVLASDDQRVFLQGSTALLIAGTDKETALAIIERGRELMLEFISDENFIDLLRVYELAITQAELTPDDLLDLRQQLAEEYPSSSGAMNRELVRLLVYMQADEVVERMVEELDGEAMPTEKLHLALSMRYLTGGWSSDHKFKLLQYLETIRYTSGAGHSFAGYLDAVSRDFVATLDEGERTMVLLEGAKWPATALAVLANSASNVTDELVDQLIALDRDLTEASQGKDVDALNAEDMRKLATGIVAVLGISNNDNAMAYLREQFEQQPARRADLSMGLAQSPAGENWPLLTGALATLEGPAAQEVLRQLATTDETPDNPETLRQAILCGLRLGENGGHLAAKLLTKWTGEEAADPDATWDQALANWQAWYSSEYPNAPAPTLPVEAKDSKWTSDTLLGHLAETTGDPVRGAKAFEKGQCNKCHRFGGKGESIGPDLSTLSRRFQTKEIIESVLFPSHVISDQYASQTIVTSEGLTYTGIVGESGEDKIIVLQANTKKVTLSKSDIDKQLPSKKSAMPEGLFDKLTLEEITDLMAYLSLETSGEEQIIQSVSEPSDLRVK